MRKFSIIISFALALSGFTACQKDDTLRYSNITMGNIVNGVFAPAQRFHTLLKFLYLFYTYHLNVSKSYKISDFSLYLYRLTP